jgi:YfhG lipoprotein
MTTKHRRAQPIPFWTQRGRWLAVSALVSMSGGCTLLHEMRSAPPAPAASEAAPADMNGIKLYLETMNGLGSVDAARQADVFYEVERDYTRAPTTTSTMRYAVALVTPGHPATKPAEGKRLIETLLVTPERLTQDERTLAAVLLNETNARLKLEAENRRLLATLDDRSRSQANSDKRVQTQLEENARLRRALAEAQQKLDAIKEIERSIIERSPTPPGSRDTAPSETQSSSISR